MTDEPLPIPKRSSIAARRASPETIPVATREETAAIEAAIHKLCDHQIPLIPSMSSQQLDDFIWQGVLAYDIELGRFPSQVPHIIHHLSPEHLAWEEYVLGLIEEREQQLDG